MRSEDEIRSQIEALEEVEKMIGLSQDQKRFKNFAQWVLDE